MDNILDSTDSVEFEGKTYELPKLTVAHINNCAFGSWFPIFKKFSFKSKIIELPSDHPFVAYLNQDGIYLNDNIKYEPSPDMPEQLDEQDELEVTAPSFPELEKEIMEIIEDFDGAVFPKLNWSSPKDATWISTTGTLKCETVSEIFLLLKSSDYITHDLSQPYAQCEEESDTKPSHFQLVLKKWVILNSSLEFRCFVKDNCLIGISQREQDSCFPFLKEVREVIKRLMVNFYYKEVAKKFPGSNFIFDVYVSKNYDRVWLVDFNAFGTITEPLLFTWEEICLRKVDAEILEIIEQNEWEQEIDELCKEAELRIQEKEGGVYKGSDQNNRFPKDLYDLSQSDSVDAFVTAFREGKFDNDQ